MTVINIPPHFLSSHFDFLLDRSRTGVEDQLGGNAVLFFLIYFTISKTQHIKAKTHGRSITGQRKNMRVGFRGKRSF